MKETHYPKTRCQTCGYTKDYKAEEVDIGMGEIELWVWCRTCDIETFHWIEKCDKYPNNRTKEEYEY